MRSMSEHNVVRGTAVPSTRQSLGADLQSLGVRPGMLVLVHVSLSSLGWVCGGAVAVIQALLDAVGEAGTLVMPSHSGDLSDPSSWVNPPVPPEWWQLIRDELPGYDPLITPTLGVGRVAEVFRRWPGALRSAHPVMSFSARGPRALDVVGSHELGFSLGDGSPLARLHELDASVLLVGVDHDRNTSLHLAEYRAGIRPERDCGAPVLVDGRRVWHSYRDIDLDDDDFLAIGRAFEEGTRVRLGQVGAAQARLFSQREVVDFAASFLRTRHGPRGAK
jgi:aminoglycoside 3-N-acetyltransferase